MFVKALIFYHFILEHHIQIEIDVSGYSIGRVFSPLILDDLSQWHPLFFFFEKMIPAKTRYETHNGEILAIVVTFKT